MDNTINKALPAFRTNSSQTLSGKNSKVSGSENKSTQNTSAEKVLLTTKAKDISKINEIIKTSPDFRIEKVERLKIKIASGAYSVAGEEIAEKILNEILAESEFLK